MASQGITFAALLLALAAFTHAADTTHKNDARIFDNTALAIGDEGLFYIGVFFVGVLLLTVFLGLIGTSAKVAEPYDYVSATAYGAAPAYDEKSTYKVHQVIEDAFNKFQ